MLRCKLVLGLLMLSTMLLGGCPQPGISQTQFEDLLRQTGTQVAGIVLANVLIGPIRAISDAVGQALAGLFGPPIA